MRLSKGFWQTFKEAPNDAEIPSHILMMRAGMLHKAASGLYNYLPMGLRAIQKVENIIREEHTKFNFFECKMTMVTPGELWKESGRWGKMDGVMLKAKDKNDRDVCLSPTNEEAISEIFRKTIKSYKQLPLGLYQINTKFRDEIRPRYGLMRGREFIMKDAYSFVLGKEAQDKIYNEFYQVYTNIFNRMGLKFMAVEADAGDMGDEDSKTHEFQVLAENGEDLIVYGKEGKYAANIEKAITKRTVDSVKGDNELEDFPTPGRSTCEQVSEMLNIPIHHTLKALAFNYTKSGEEKRVLIFVLGDDSLNEVKFKNFFGAETFFPTPLKELEANNLPAGYMGPQDHPKEEIYFDEAIDLDGLYVVGANKKDFHTKNFRPSRDCPQANSGDFRLTREDDVVSTTGEAIEFKKGIEVGHIFQLGDKYTKAMECYVQDENGKQAIPQMGCYGIGVTRTVASCIEQNHDENGIIWPAAIAPYHLYFGVIGKSQETKDLASEIYQELNLAGIETVFDDRGVGPGFMFKDSDLLGLPLRVVLGERDYKKDGLLEIKIRRTGESHKVSREELIPKVKDLLKDL